MLCDLCIHLIVAALQWQSTLVFCCDPGMTSLTAGALASRCHLLQLEASALKQPCLTWLLCGGHTALITLLLVSSSQSVAPSGRYMAPEVLSSEVTPASDIWSAGVMAFQLLTGRFPFDDRRNPFNPSISKIW